MTATVTQITRGDLSCWEIRHRNQTLVIAEQGAQVLAYQRDGEHPLIWLSEEAAYHKGQGVRGGVPVCWPWFGALAFNPAAIRQQYALAEPPAHGLVRQQPWTLHHTQEDTDGITLTFGLSDLADRQSLPPVEPTLTVRLDDSLRLALNNHNHGTEPVWISQALHSYFAVSDCRQVTVHGLETCPYVDALDDWQSHRQENLLTFLGETDRLYLQLPDILHIDDPGWQRRVTLSASGSRSAVVWNPWVEKSRRLTQFASDAWQRMLCIETARVLDNALLLGPGEQHSMVVRFVTTAL
ncbi:MAG: D-hexose-6-phosphate mutarotase [Alcanivorax sp.]|uniref:D-hexose-6-phosphate mutarotase n=1 Tax=Alcanivorax sp. TaxID=1872427 RepID=UPI003DA7A21C